MKKAVFWDVISCSLVDIDISEELTASIIRVMNVSYFKGRGHLEGVGVDGRIILKWILWK
jgi:hypothetical protein